MKKAQTSSNKRLALRALFAPSGSEKPQSAQAPWCGFLYATFGAGVNAYALPYYLPQTSPIWNVRRHGALSGKIISNTFLKL